jgi:hypothetical protein
MKTGRNLTTLEIKMLRGDLIKVFKILKGFEIVELNGVEIKFENKTIFKLFLRDFIKCKKYYLKKNLYIYISNTNYKRNFIKFERIRYVFSKIFYIL